MTTTMEEIKEVKLEENRMDRDASNSYITKNTNAQTLANIQEAVAQVIREDGPLDETTEEFRNFVSPTYNVKRIHLDLIRPNNTNFNVIAPREMALLYRSIRLMGYVMPILTSFRKEEYEEMYKVIPDKYLEDVDAFKKYLEGLVAGNTPEKGEMTDKIMEYTKEYLEHFDEDGEDGMPNKYFIRTIDGHHRRAILEYCSDLRHRERNCVPCAMVYNLNYADKLAMSITMNAAKGSSQMENMAEIVAELTALGKSNAWIQKKVGLSIDEIVRLKTVTGIASLFSDKDFSSAWSLIDSTDEDAENELTN